MDKKEPLTKYGGKLSDDSENRNRAEILGSTPRTRAGDLGKKWKDKIIIKIHEKIEAKELRPVPAGSSCNLYVTFRLKKSDGKRQDSNFADVDNLLKPFLDSLKNKNKNKGKYDDRKYLIEDDSYFRGIKAEKELVKKDTEEGVVFRYLITKTFKIDKVEDIKREELKRYRTDWQHPMVRIFAREYHREGKEEVLKGEPRSLIFIDNRPGEAFKVTKSGEIYWDVIPGYNWKTIEKVAGCMVFRREPTTTGEAGQDEGFFWLKKWS